MTVNVKVLTKRGLSAMRATKSTMQSSLTKRVFLSTCLPMIILFSFTTPAQAAPLGNHPDSGWYYNNNSTVYDDSSNSGLLIYWSTSYVYPYTGDPQYWYASIVYKNLGKQLVYFNCNQFNSGSVQEYMQGTGNAGSVTAYRTLCSDNPGFIASLAPGRSFESYAIFHNVPWSGARVALQWGPYGPSQYVDPWASKVNGDAPTINP